MSAPSETTLTTHPERLKHLPISIFAMAMGSTGLTIAWQRAAPILGAPPLVGQILVVLAACLMLLLTGSYLLKIIRHPDAVLEEFNHPIKIAFSPPSRSACCCLPSPPWVYPPGCRCCSGCLASPCTCC